MKTLFQVTSTEIVTKFLRPTDHCNFFQVSGVVFLENSRVPVWKISEIGCSCNDIPT